MSRLRKPWLRGVLTLGVVGMFGAGMLVSNVGAVAEKREASKKFVKKRLNKLNNSINNTEGIFHSFKNGPVDTPDALGTLATLNVPAGHYAVNAKLYIVDDTTSNAEVRCVLAAGASTDESQLMTESGNNEQLTLALQLVVTLNAPGTITLSCEDDETTTDTKAHQIKITAIRARSLQSTASA